LNKQQKNVLSLQKKSSTRQSESELSLRSFAFSLQKKRRRKRKDMKQENVSSRLPELSPSETEICRLIIQGKKQNEICTILGKKESNISCQRTNIRRKLNLTPDENLKKALIERLRSTK
jgi:DNA-binding CsgD family transcriptional regulator